MRSLLDLVFPQSCGGCGLEGPAVCGECAATLLQPPRLTMPTPCPAALPPVWSVAPYDGIPRRLLLAWKENDAVGVRTHLAGALARAVDAAVPGRGAVVLLPVPSSRPARRRRGADVAAELAKSAAGHLRALGRPCRTRRLLTHSRSVADSAGLGSDDRARNLRGALHAAPARTDAARPHLVLVDDLVTTGATLAEAARALRAAGHHPSAAAAVLATTRRRPLPQVQAWR